MKNRAMRPLYRYASVIACAGIAWGIAIFAVGCTSDGIGQLEIVSQCLVGDQLHLIVETSRRYYPWFAEHTRTVDMKGYFIVIDLLSKQPLKDRARVFGPIWDEPNSQYSRPSEIFPRQNTNPEADEPYPVLDGNGTLLRFTSTGSPNTMMRDELVVTPISASWQRQRSITPVDAPKPPGSEDRLLTESGRFLLLFQNGRAECFDRFTGDRIEDPWLTQRFAEVRSIPNLKNIRLFLTEDLNHLVVSPMAAYNNGQKIFDTFIFQGKTIKRSDVGMAYSRPAEVPFLFARKAQDNFNAQPPHDAFTIGGQPYLFMSDKTMLRLYTLDESHQMVAHSTPEVHWKASPYPRIQHAPKNGEIILYETALDGDFNTILSVFRWKYGANSVTRDEVRFAELFTSRGGRLLPKSGIGVN